MASLKLLSHQRRSRFVPGLTALLMIGIAFVPSRVAADANETAVNGAASSYQASITTGDNQTCVLLSNGSAKCWGSNSAGQLGDSTNIDRSVPTQVSGLTSGITSTTAGSYFTCALLSTGAVKCWGVNAVGQLGDGTTTDKNIPTQVSGLTSGVTSITAGANHACALLSSGAVKCWGSNSNGQLGDGANGYARYAPTQVSGLASGVTAIAAGDNHTCALLATGGVKCWGYNVFGNLGDGSTTDRLIPTQVSGLTSGVTAIAGGGYNTCALLSSGAAKCWGYNGVGQIGDGTTTSRNTPTQVSGLTSGVVALTTGGYHSCALLATGAANCWGLNNLGQAGDGTTTNRNTPTQVSGLTTGVTAITTGNAHTCALLTTGAVNCWGYNNAGRLGDGTTTNQYTPTQVSGLTTGVGPTTTTTTVPPTTTTSSTTTTTTAPPTTTTTLPPTTTTTTTTTVPPTTTTTSSSTSTSSTTTSTVASTTSTTSTTVPATSSTSTSTTTVPPSTSSSTVPTSTSSSTTPSSTSSTSTTTTVPTGMASLISSSTSTSSVPTSTSMPPVTDMSAPPTSSSSTLATTTTMPPTTTSTTSTIPQSEGIVSGDTKSIATAMSKDSARKTVAYIDGKKADVKLSHTSTRITVTVAGTSTTLSATAPDGATVNLTADGVLEVQRGSNVSTATTGFEAYSNVESWCYSSPLQLGTERTNGLGATSAKYQIPNSVPLGNHHLVIRGTNSQGQSVTIGFALRVSDHSLITRLASSPFTWVVLVLALLFALFLPSRLRRRENNSQ